MQQHISEEEIPRKSSNLTVKLSQEDQAPSVAAHNTLMNFCRKCHFWFYQTRYFSAKWAWICLAWRHLEKRPEWPTNHWCLVISDSAANLWFFVLFRFWNHHSPVEKELVNFNRSNIKNKHIVFNHSKSEKVQHTIPPEMANLFNRVSDFRGWLIREF